MKNSKKDMTEKENNQHIEADDFSVDENINTATDQEQTSEPAIIPNEEILKLQAEVQEQKDKYVRLFAEFDNYRRRTSKESIELRQTAGIEVIVSLLEVLDDMDRAEKQLEENETNQALKEGILLIFNKFRKILQAKGLKAIETLHSDFDVEKDEAISEIEVPDEKLKGKVVAEVQKGYFLNDKLIRFAKVVVGK
jgi:molecular chaperone GrpE